MKKRGFTLIELLAVIVVLAIIALIATPIVMNVIKNAQMGAAERSADNYVKAVDLLISTNKLDGNKVADGEYTIQADGNLTFGEVEVSGTKPNGGTIVVENGQVVKDESSISVGDYTVTYKDGVASAEKIDNSELGRLCELVSGTANTIGAKYTCDLGAGDRTFYVLEAGTSGKPVTLILEGNYDTEKLAWCDSKGANPYDTACAADGLTAKLDEIAEVWTELDRNQIDLPSASQIVVADGRAEDAYLDYPGLSNEWLYSWDNEEWKPNGMTPPAIQEYWTSTPDASNSRVAFVVMYNGNIRTEMVSGQYGVVRPVIMLSI